MFDGRLEFRIVVYLSIANEIVCEGKKRVSERLVCFLIHINNSESYKS